MALIPKITNALAKFVSPIGQSTAQTKTGTDPRPPQLSIVPSANERQTQDESQQQPPEQQKRLKLVPSDATDPENEEGTEIATKSQEFRRFQPKALSPAAEEQTEEPAQTDEPVAAAPTPPPSGEQSVTAKILDLFRSFHDGKKTLNQAAGNQAYKDITKEEQKGKFRRGAMLDEKIE